MHSDSQFENKIDQLQPVIDIDYRYEAAITFGPSNTSLSYVR